LANKLAPEATLEQLGKLALVDKRGRNKKKGEPLKRKFKEVDEFLKHAKKAKVLEQTEKPILLGRDLLDVIKPGPEMGKLLKQAYKIQIEEGIKDKQTLKRLVLNYSE